MTAEDTDTMYEIKLGTTEVKKEKKGSTETSHASSLPTCSRDKCRSSYEFLWRNYDLPCNASVGVIYGSLGSGYGHDGSYGAFWIAEICKDYDVHVALNGGDRCDDVWL